MKYLAVLFITAIAATTLVNSSAVLNKEEKQTCDVQRLQNLAQAFTRCASTLASACANSGTDGCGCCRNILGGSSSATGYSCCETMRNFIDIAKICAKQNGVSIPSQIANCNLGSGAATTTVSYFTGLLLLLAAAAYQFLF